LVSRFNVLKSFNYTPNLFYKKLFKSEINSFCIWTQVCKSLSSEESWGSSEEGYQYRARYTLPPPPEAAPVTKSADPPRDKIMAPNEETITTAPAAGSPVPPLGALLPRVTRSVYDEEEEEEELVPSVPLASEDSDLGESGDFESYSDADPEEEETGATKTTDDDVDIVTLK
jgi:hypothetical protein